MKLITVLMPVYNAEQYIAQAIDSILSQSHHNLELLICDDCSSDDSLNIIRTYDDKRITLYTNAVNVGYLKTCNYLASVARGEYLTFQDADDISMANRLEVLVAELTKRALSLIGSNVAYADVNGVVLRCSDYPLSHGLVQTTLKTSMKYPFCGAAVLFKKELYDTCGLYDERFDRIGAEDYDWIYRVSRIFELGNTPEILYNYRLTSGSISRSTAIINPLMLYSEDLARELYQNSIRTPPRDDSNVFDEFVNLFLEEYKSDRSRVLFKDLSHRVILGDRLGIVWLLVSSCKYKMPVKTRLSFVVKCFVFTFFSYKSVHTILSKTKRYFSGKVRNTLT